MGPFHLTPSVEFWLLPLSLKCLAPLQILVGIRGVAVSPRMIRVGDIGTVVIVAVVAEIGVIRGSSGVLNLLPTEEVSTTRGCFTFSSGAFPGDCPGVRILEAGVAITVRAVAIVGRLVEPHLWECYGKRKRLYSSISGVVMALYTPSLCEGASGSWEAFPENPASIPKFPE